MHESKFVLLLFLLPVVFTTFSVPTATLFQNTLKRWGVNITSDADKRERWNKFSKDKVIVEERTSGVILDSLNSFSVMTNAEFKRSLFQMQSRLNMSDLVKSTKKSVEDHGRHIREADIPTANDYWEKSVGFNPAVDQYGCGSCWVFAAVAAIEGVYKKVTGEFAKFSEQHVMECTGIGCAGGCVSDAYSQIGHEQYMVYNKDHKYTAVVGECDVATSFPNAMKKAWLQNWNMLPATEDAFIGGLAVSPVGFGLYICEDFSTYTGGIWNDLKCIEGCSKKVIAHAMTLVGYTKEYIRVRNSWGAGWGESGYGNIARAGDGDGLAQCNVFQTAYTISMTPRRELKYKFCNKGKLATYSECNKSCKAMNKESETGWTLAVIPSRYHNQLVIDIIEKRFPGVKNDEKYDLLWIGFKFSESQFSWVDGVTPLNYFNLHRDSGDSKLGMINKNTGMWYTKGSRTFTARGLCSRAETCWDAENAVENGHVTFDRTELTEGTKGIVTCDAEGSYTLTGASTLTCVGGNWSPEFPTCT